MSKYPNFINALRALGKDNSEIAARLGVSKSMLYYYLRGETLPPVEKVKQFAELDEALTLDIRGEKTSCPQVQIPA